MFYTYRAIIFSLVILTFNSGCKLISDDSTTETTTSAADNSAPTVDFQVAQDNATNTPPKNDDPTVLPPPPLNSGDTEFQEGFSINNDALYTNQNFVTLTFRTLAPFKIKIGSSLNCSDGVWENYVDQKNIDLTQLNQPITYSVRFQDWEGSLSTCYRKTITHDNIGPEVVFQSYPPATSELGTTLGDLTFYVRDDRSVSIDVFCIMNDIQKPCFSGNNRVTLSTLPVGNYSFTVTAKDDLQNTTTKTVTWSVNNLYKKVIQKVSVDNYKKVDVLFVIDNSGSMEFEQKNMAQRTSQFLSILQGLDYQIAVTTTDPRNIALGDGRLIPITGGNGAKMITSSMNLTSAQTMLSNTLQRPETGSGDEQGIRAVYRAIERYNGNENDLRAFLRNDSQLSIVLISDEDESDNTTKNDPASLLSLINATWAGQKRFNFNSIITRPEDIACHSTNGYSYGYRYKTISDLTGGVIGNVCDMDYTNQVRGISDEIRRLLKTLTLSCQPLSQFPLTIKRNAVALTQTYTIEGLNIKFTTELDPGSYEIEYSCLK